MPQASYKTEVTGASTDITTHVAAVCGLPHQTSISVIQFAVDLVPTISCEKMSLSQQPLEMTGLLEFGQCNVGILAKMYKIQTPNTYKRYYKPPSPIFFLQNS